jgi:maltose alpha-D-glucosyltransferase/alpha-amylase
VNKRKSGIATDPLWYKDAIIYELHVKAFSDSNGDGIGDFPGLLSKLDYLRDLGITCIWLLPFFPSPLRDDGYDIADYMDVNPAYGTLNDFKAFLSEAHKRGLQVMIELVINHTSDQHPWFQAARRAAPGTPEREMYVWSDTDKLFSGVRIIFTDTEKSNWTWDEEAKAYYWHRFFSHQPDLNFDNPRVLEEVLRAMRFWLDMGVDGLRLDAIPYLVERDGTSCENLPETHVLIRQIRQAIDEEYENRLVLAEANMWPADVRPYFGDGDECHMAFHFPLMPRIYMALRQEDRLPITEIMAQTPDIPENCQWGLFLRNHDELTLEMVTNDERDYMYFAYSADPRMRVNVGIRRRLAPLLDNNRRRIELLNSLLFSFPGTPILYYGDELGMGDNIYLGDRNGVRTPMQWNSDRNAGFSRATPAKLYSPVIMDPVWGYQAINVEAQEGDTSSLLNWTRNMIALRKLFRVFGRGSLSFLKPDNRKVLAYVREYDGERVLCVANLSRFAQAVFLDLSRWEDSVPVEMLGYVTFPSIGKEPYVLTLGPYAFLWLELQEATRVQEVPAISTPIESTALVTEVTDIMSGPGLELFQESMLPKYLCQQRWFGSKSKIIQNVTVFDWAKLPNDDSLLLLLQIAYKEEEPETYILPIALVSDEITVEERHLIGHIAGTGTESNQVIIDALALPGTRAALLEIIQGDKSISSAKGTIQGIAGLLAKEAPSAQTSRLSSAEQSNSSTLFGDSLILKLFRRVQPGINPDVEIGKMLTEVVKFPHIAPYAGEIVYKTKDQDTAEESEYVLALLQGQVRNVGDGWYWSLEHLQKAQRSPAPEDVLEYFETAIELLAQRTAEMHSALEQAKGPDFDAIIGSPEMFAEEANKFRGQIAATFSALRQRFSELPDDQLTDAALLFTNRQLIETFADKLADVDVSESGRRTRIHGDFHLGQVLRTQDDFVILDFEGEPVKSLEERRTRKSPLRDVAGMLRSFSYVVAVSIQQQMDPDGLLKSREQTFKTRYLDGYVLARSEKLTPAMQTMLKAYLLEKALYELEYELNHRPQWVNIPLRGVLEIIQGTWE